MYVCTCNFVSTKSQPQSLCCMYAYTYVCMYVCMYVYIHDTCDIYVCIQMNICPNNVGYFDVYMYVWYAYMLCMYWPSSRHVHDSIHIHTYIYTHVHTHTEANMYSLFFGTHMIVYMYIHACTYMYIRTCTGTYTQK